MLTFSKMHGIGNDYIYINCFQETVTDPEKALYFYEQCSVWCWFGWAGIDFTV